MADIPPYTDLPYMIGVTSTQSFAFYPSGAIRQLIATEELSRLRDEMKVRAFNLSAAEAQTAANVSKKLFGI